ncbi:MAG: signal peptidase I [Ruminococcaceae bacterium]|nr:signal peptidase I [Oscillospiraceae bacterium]
MKKTLNIIKNVLIWLVVAIAVCMMIFTLVSVNVFDKNDRTLFGYKFFIVQTDSMSKTDFDAGDIAIAKEVDPSTLKEGDIITFVSQNSANYGETVTHKIRSVTVDANGDRGFITYGTTTGVDDETVVTYPFIIGKYQGHIPNLGSFFVFLKTTSGYIVCILIPFLLLILSQGINCVRLFRRYKAEQMEEMQAEKDQLAREKEENQKMMAELLELKKQLAANAASEASAPTEQAAPTAEQKTEEQL